VIKVLLLEEIDKVGEIGDVVSVRNGYARNFLIPSGKALRATKEAVKVYEARKAELLKQRDQRIASTRAIFEKLNGLRLAIHANSSPDGKLYGSIGPGIITQEAEGMVPDARGFLKQNQVRLPAGGIKMVGEHQVAVSLSKDFQAEITIAVTSDDYIPPAPVPDPEPAAAAAAQDGPPSDEQPAQAEAEQAETPSTEQKEPSE